MLRQEEADGDQDAYARSTPAPRTRAPQRCPAGNSHLPDTVLVFRDQHKQEVHNYAIVGQTLWNFAPRTRRRIPLADLDLPATTKANDDRGVTFRVPPPTKPSSTSARPTHRAFSPFTASNYGSPQRHSLFGTELVH